MSRETRDRIIKAAYATLVRLGYEATSVKDIAAAAGVAPGLLHYYFDSKEELVLAAIRFACDEFGRPGELGPEQEARAAFAEARSRLGERTPFHRLFFDMCGVAMHNPAVAEVLRRFVAEDRAVVERMARDVLALRERPHAEAAPIAGAVWGGMFGIVLQGLLDPGFDSEGAIDALARMAMEGN